MSRDLSDDLAQYLRNTRDGLRAWREMPTLDGGRIDVFAARFFYDDARPHDTRAYEVKASRADLLSDLRSGKWERYLGSCRRFYFACAPGIAKRGDMPAEAGLIVKVRGDAGKPYTTGWRTVKPAPPREVGLDIRYALLLLERHLDVEAEQQRVAHRAALVQAASAEGRGVLRLIGRDAGQDFARWQAERHHPQLVPALHDDAREDRRDAGERLLTALERALEAVGADHRDWQIAEDVQYVAGLVVEARRMRLAAEFISRGERAVQAFERRFGLG